MRRDEAERALEASRSRLERLLQTAPIGILEVSHTAITFANGTACELLRLVPDEAGAYGAPGWVLQHVDGAALDPSDNPLVKALAGAEVKNQELALVYPGSNERIVVAVNAAPIREGTVVAGGLASFVDISERYAAEQALREQTRRLETLNQTGTAIAGELDLESLIQSVIDAGVRLTGAEAGAFFYNGLNAGGEPAILHRFSGNGRLDVDALPMGSGSGDGAARAVPADGVVLSADTWTDPRFAAPEGAERTDDPAPMRSHLGVPVLSRSAEVIGRMAFGHSDPGVFGERHEKLLSGIAAQAAIAMDNARLYEAAQQAEAAVRSFNQSLEGEIAARTGELQLTNRKLVGEIAQREIVEEQLRQAQKMEAVGQLTGGMAHDFNNLLAIVIGSLDVLGRRIEKGRTNDIKRFIDSAMDGANRAAALTQRLLAFARRQPLAPVPIDTNRLVVEMAELLGRTISGNVKVETELDPRTWDIHADRNQLENALLNLAVNARDAMPEGGRLTLRTSNVHLEADPAAASPGARDGEYVLLAVTDTGTGMAPEVVARAFDPFFTTKETGKGTGLGLSQIYGFVQQTGGHIRIESAVGEGSTIKMFLPRFVGPAEGDVVTHRQPEDATEGATVLVVEDESGVRLASCEAVRELGYAVLEASTAVEALRILDAHPEIDVLFTDIVMPDVSGSKLAAEALLRRPTLKVLFTSGYAYDGATSEAMAAAGAELMAKPFAVEQLGAKLRQLLDGREEGL